MSSPDRGGQQQPAPAELSERQRIVVAARWDVLRPHLQAAEGVLAATGSAVALCPSYGPDAQRPELAR